MLFRCLDVEQDHHRPSLSLTEIGFLDNWEASASESEEEPEERRRAESSRKARQTSARPPRPAGAGTAGAALPELRSRSQPERDRPTGPDLTAILRGPEPPQPPRPPRPRKDPRQEHEQWVQQREQEVQSVYRVASERQVNSSEVTKRLYHPEVRDPKTGVPSWLHSLREVTRSRSEALLPRRPGDASRDVSRGTSRNPSRGSASRAREAESPTDPIYRYGSHGTVVAPFHLNELNLQPLQGEEMSRRG
ncbi:unnamed protein product [Durusdinium trenchii]